MEEYKELLHDLIVFKWLMMLTMDSEFFDNLKHLQSPAIFLKQQATAYANLFYFLTEHEILTVEEINKAAKGEVAEVIEMIQERTGV